MSNISEPCLKTLEMRVVEHFASYNSEVKHSKVLDIKHSSLKMQSYFEPENFGVYNSPSSYSKQEPG